MGRLNNVATAPSIVVLLRMISGAFIWALHFTAVYGFTTLACARGFASTQWLGIGVVAWACGAVTVIALAAVCSVVVAALRTVPRVGFVEWMTASIAALAALAIAWEALPPIMVPGCA